MRDLAQAHISAMARLLKEKDGSGLSLNLGTGSGLSVRQILDAVERVTGLSMSYTMGPRRAGDPPSLVADASRALRILGWRPEHSGVDEIIRDAWNWYCIDKTNLQTAGPGPGRPRPRRISIFWRPVKNDSAEMHFSRCAALAHPPCSVRTFSRQTAFRSTASTEPREITYAVPPHALWTGQAPRTYIIPAD